jgi:excisionase family DNA binding protein
MTQSDTITTAQAAEILRCSPRTIARMVEGGRLVPALKFPGKNGGYLFSPAEIERVREDLARKYARRASELTESRTA